MNSLLLRVDPTTNQPLLPSGGAIRTLVENTRVEIIKHLRKRWMQVREKTGFVGLETWALKEISDGACFLFFSFSRPFIEPKSVFVNQTK